jgi:hypothetical protein
MSNAARVILSDDYFEYDVFVFERPTSEPTGIGGFRIGFTDTSTTAGFTINDADGRSLAQPNVLFGKWKSRKVSLSPVAGKTSAYWAMTRAADTAGDYKAVYRNIRITDGAGTTRLQVWESGEPPASYVEFSNLTTNAQAGPANSFHVYVFDSTPTQVANDFSWLFQGV